MIIISDMNRGESTTTGSKVNIFTVAAGRWGNDAYGPEWRQKSTRSEKYLTGGKRQSRPYCAARAGERIVTIRGIHDHQATRTPIVRTRVLGPG